jgi:hypothetical protein
LSIVLPWRRLLLLVVVVLLLRVAGIRVSEEGSQQGSQLPDAPLAPLHHTRTTTCCCWPLGTHALLLLLLPLLLLLGGARCCVSVLVSGCLVCFGPLLQCGGR